MTRFLLLAVGFFGTLGWAVPAMAQTTTTVKYQQGTNGYSGCLDTYIDRDPVWIDDWFGNETRIEIRSGFGTPGEKMNILIKFDVSALPSNATVTGAKLTLHNIRERSANGDAPVLEKVTAAWNNQTTWNQWNTGVPNTVASGVTCPTIAGLTEDPLTPEPYVITGLAALVTDWKATPALNYGIMLSATTDINLRFASSEYATVSVRPELEITYTTPAPANPPTATVTSPPTTALSSPITVSGTASATSPATVATVTWFNGLSGAAGPASGTTNWTATIPLVNGNNPITITVTDSTGAQGTTSFTVGYFPPRPTNKDNTYCGIGAIGGTSGSVAVAALLLALLITATVRRPA
jgi:hypothetical protein